MLTVKQNPNEQAEPRHAPHEALDGVRCRGDDRMPNVVPVRGLSRVNMGRLRHGFSFLVQSRTGKTNCAGNGACSRGPIGGGRIFPSTYPTGGGTYSSARLADRTWATVLRRVAKGGKRGTLVPQRGTRQRGPTSGNVGGINPSPKSGAPSLARARTRCGHASTRA